MSGTGSLLHGNLVGDTDLVLSSLLRTHLIFLGLILALGTSGRAVAQDGAKTEIVPQIEHTNVITSNVFSPDGKLVLTSSYDSSARLWNAETGVLLRVFRGHEHVIHAAAFSPDGRLVLSGSHDRTLRLWETASGRLVRTIAHPGEFSVINSAAYSPDGKRLYSGTLEGTVRIWDAASGALLRKMQDHQSQVHSLAISADGKRLLSGSADKSLILWNALTGEMIRRLTGHTGEVVSVALSADGTRAISGSNDGTVKYWNLRSGTLVRTFAAHRRRPPPDKSFEKAWLDVKAVAISPDGSKAVAGYFDSTINLWDVASGNLVHSKVEQDKAMAAAFSPDGTLILTGGLTRSKIWDAATGSLRLSFDAASELYGSRAELSADGARLITQAGTGMRVWDVVSGRLLRVHQHQSGGDWRWRFSALWRQLVDRGAAMPAGTWDALAAAPIPESLGNPRNKAEAELVSVAHSTDGRLVVTVDKARLVKVWDAASGRILRIFDGKAPGARFWDHTRAALSPDGGRLVVGASRSLKLFDVTSGALVRNLAGHADAIHSVKFTRDSRHILSTSSDKSIRLWDARSGALLRTFRGHDNSVWEAEISPDGARLAAASRDETVRLWEVASGKLLRTLDEHRSSVDWITFSRDGQRLVTGGRDGTIMLWTADGAQRLATFSPGRDGEWLVMTPHGFYAASHRDPRMLAIVRRTEATSIAQVHQSLFNPDLVRESLAGDPDGEVAKAAEVIGLDKVIDSGPPPAAVIVSHPEESSAAKEVERFTARITDRGKGIGRIEWRANGTTVGVSTRSAGTGLGVTVTRDIALDAGDNTIEVVAYNGSNLLASLPARATVKFAGPADKAKPKLHILAIGINQYVDKGWTPPGSSEPIPFEPLDLAVDDAKAFGAAMKKAAAGLYDEVLVTEVLDQDATRENLPRIVDTVAAKIHPRDSFILFVAAHGYSMKTNGRFYLIPQDYQGGPNPEALAIRAIGQDQLQDWLANRIKAKRALILLDTCESGALIAGHTRARTDASEAAIGRLHEATGRPVLTAAALGQSAQEGEIGASGEKHGLFTWAVLDALRKGDSNGNGLIELSELVNHVQTTVPRIAAKGGSRGQVLASETEWEKQSARFGSRGEDFVVARRLP